MAEFTLEQQRALAIAQARARASQSTQPVEEEEKEPAGNLEYLFNALKVGAPKGIGGAAAQIETVTQKAFIEPMTQLYEVLGLRDRTPAEVTQANTGLVPTLQAKTSAYTEPLAAITGGDVNMKAPNIVTRAIGSGVELMSDPAALLMPGSTISRKLPALFGLGITADISGEVGGQVEKAITGKETGAGRMLGSTAGALKSAPAAAAVSEGVSATRNIAGQLYNKYKTVKADPTQAEQSVATGAAQRLLEKVSAGYNEGDIDKIVTDFNKISNKFDQKDLPLLFALADDPVLRQQAERLAKNPQYRQVLDAEVAKLTGLIDTKASELFGTRYSTTNPDFVAALKFPKAEKSIMAAQDKVAKIDQKLVDLTTKFIPSQTDEQIGRVATNLIELKSRAIKDELAPVYSTIIQDAKKAGAKLPAESTRNLYNFVVDNRLRDIFGKGTPLDKDLVTNFAPKEGQFFPVNFETVDSLKRRVNEIQRQNLTPTEERLLTSFEAQLNAERAKIPGNFNDRLMAVDKAYYERLGVPFNEQAIKNIDSRKYAEQIAPKIIENGSATRQFLNVAGAEGIPVVQNSIVADVYKRAIKDGAINRPVLAKYIKDNAEVIRQVPNLEKELKAALVDDSRLRLKKAELDENVKIQEKRLADNFIREGLTDYKTIVNNSISNPRYLMKIQKDIGDLDAASAKAVRQAIRSEFVEVARNSPDGALNFLTNPRNKLAVNQVFGKTYINDVLDLAKLSDQAAKADVSRINTAVTTQELDALAKITPGLDIPYVASTLRDRISSNFQKGVRILTRINTARTKEATDDAFIQLLVDPNGINKVRNAAAGMDFKIKSPTDLKKVVDALGDVMPRAIYGGTSVGIEGGLNAQQNLQNTPVEEEDNISGGFR